MILVSFPKSGTCRSFVLVNLRSNSKASVPYTSTSLFNGKCLGNGSLWSCVIVNAIWTSTATWTAGSSASYCVVRSNASRARMSIESHCPTIQSWRWTTSLSRWRATLTSRSTSTMTSRRRSGLLGSSSSTSSVQFILIISSKWSRDRRMLDSKSMLKQRLATTSLPPTNGHRS